MKPPPTSAMSSAATAPTSPTTTETSNNRNRRRVRFPPTIVTRRISPPATHENVASLLESGLVWYKAAEIQEFQVQDLREAAHQQREERRRIGHNKKKKSPQLLEVVSEEWTSRGLESLSRDRAKAKDQASRDRRSIIKAYKLQQKQHDDSNDNNPTTTTKEDEDLRQLYLTLSKEARERAVGYGKYDAAQAQAQEADEKENHAQQQQNRQHPSNGRSRTKKWTRPIQNMKGYFKSKGQQQH